jgi:hypothetical protein
MELRIIFLPRRREGRQGKTESDGLWFGSLQIVDHLLFSCLMRGIFQLTRKLSFMPESVRTMLPAFSGPFLLSLRPSRLRGKIPSRCDQPRQVECCVQGRKVIDEIASYPFTAKDAKERRKAMVYGLAHYQLLAICFFRA